MTEVQIMLPDECFVPAGLVDVPSRRSASGYREDYHCKAAQANEKLSDLKLALRVMELAGLRHDAADTPDDSPSAASPAEGEFQVDLSSPQDWERCLMLIGRALKLLRRCGYPEDDVRSIAAHASAYLDQVLAHLRLRKDRPRMKLSELAQVFYLLLYLAHVYVEDEHCQLGTWHKWLSKGYCDLSTLNSAVLSIMDTLNFSLRVDEADLSRRLKFLTGGDDDNSP